MSSGRRRVLEAAAARLRGALVATPLLGEPLLVGRGVAEGLRLKLECLQCGGSAWFRGAMHALARRFGSIARLAAEGDADCVRALASAAALQRVECHALAPADAAQRAVLVALGAVLHEAQAGLPGTLARLDRAAPDFTEGLATLGLELADELPSEIVAVFVAEEFAAAVGDGLQAAGRPLALLAVPADRSPDPGLADAVLRGARVLPGERGLAALSAALASPLRPAAVLV